MKKDPGPSTQHQSNSQSSTFTSNQQTATKPASLASMAYQFPKAQSHCIINVTSPNLPGFMQIKNLVVQLNSKKMLRQQRNDILNIVSQLGLEGNQYLMECLLESLDLIALNQQAKTALHGTIKGQFLSQHLHELIFSKTAATNFMDFFPQVLLRTLAAATISSATNSNSKIPSIHTYILDLCKYLKIPVIDQMFLALSLALSYHSDLLAAEGLRMLKERISEYANLPSSSLPTMPLNILPHLLLQFVNQNPDFKNMTNEINMMKSQIIDPKNKPLLLGKNSIDDDGHGLVGSDDLHDAELHKEFDFVKLDDFNELISPADIMKDLGPEITATLEGLEFDLSIFPPTSWKAEDVCRCIETMCNQTQLSDEAIAQQKLAHSFYQAEQKNNEHDWNNFTNQEHTTIGQYQWNFEVFQQFLIRTILPKNKSLKLQDVFLSLDREDSTVIHSEIQLKQFLEFMQSIKRAYPFIFPSELLLKKWKNPKSQVQFLKHLIQIGDPDLVNLQEVLSKSSNSHSQYSPTMNFNFNPSHSFSNLTPPSAQFFACLDILNLLVELSEGDSYLTVLQTFQAPIIQYPDIISVGLAQLQQRPSKGSNLLDELFTVLLPSYFSSLNSNNPSVQTTSSIAVLDSIYRENPTLLISSICEIYRFEKSSCAQPHSTAAAATAHLNRIIDLSQYLKDLIPALTTCHDYTFAISLAIYAAKLEYLQFDQWLNERISSIGDPFVNSIFAYLDEHIVQPMRDSTISLATSNKSLTSFNPSPPSRSMTYEAILDKANITLDILANIFESLLVESEPEKLSNKNRSKLQEQYKECIQIFHVLNNASNSNLGPSAESQNQAIEKRSATQLEKFYSKELGLDEMIAQLKQQCTSNNSEDRDTFACILSSLIEEIKYHDNYPTPNLLLTGSLFGSIIFNGLLNSKPLGIMLEAIIDASKRTQKRVDFSAKAIESIRTRIIEFPNFASALFEQSCCLCDSHPSLLISIHNMMIEKKIHLNTTPKQIEQIKHRADQLKQEQLLKDQQQQQQLQLQQQQRNKTAAASQQQSQSQTQQQQQNQQEKKPNTTAPSTLPATNVPAAPPSTTPSVKQQPQQQQQSQLLKQSSAPSTAPTTIPLPTNTATSTIQQQQPITTTSQPSIIPTPAGAVIVPPTITSAAATPSINPKQPIIEEKNPPAVVLPPSTIITSISSPPEEKLIQQTSTTTEAVPADPTNQLVDPNNNPSNKNRKLQLKKGLKTNKSVFDPDSIEDSQQQGSNLSNPFAISQMQSLDQFNASRPPLLTPNSSITRQQTDDSSSQQPSQSTLLSQPQSAQLSTSQSQSTLNNQSPREEDEETFVRAYSGGVGFSQLCPPCFDPSFFMQLSFQQILQIEDTLTIEENIKNKIIFGLNNLTESSIEKHANDIKQFAENETFLNWFSRYIVLRRATLDSESQIHVFLTLIDRVNKPALAQKIVKDLLILLSKLLTSEISVSPSDRNILKSVASWVGMFTLSRNRSISAKYLNLKAILIAAYPNKLDTVIPVILHILKGSKDSKIFNPQSNRWVRRILSLLEEIKKTTLKETVKHQVKLIYTTLQIEPNLLETCTYLQHHLLTQKAAAETAAAEAHRQQLIFNNPQLSFQHNQQQLLLERSQSPFYAQIQSPISNNSSFNNTNNSSNNLIIYPQNINAPQIALPVITIDRITVDASLQDLLLPSANLIELNHLTLEALKKGIAEMLLPVFYRSFTIALAASKELILKDYCMEPDENLLLQGLTSMVQKFAGPLAMITSKELLRNSFKISLKQLLETNAPEVSTASKETIAQTLMNDNLDLGCDEISMIIVERAAQEVSNDETIRAAVEARRNARNANIVFKDEQYYQYVQALPQILQTRPTQTIAQTAATSSNSRNTNNTQAPLAFSPNNSS